MSTGMVTAITTDWRGDTLAATAAVAATVLSVEDAGDFDEDGGWLVVGDSAPLEYLTADEEAATVTLAAGLAAGYELGLPVNLWDPTVANGGAQVVEYVATVELHDDSGAVDAVIPHGLVPTSGVDYLIGASVRIAEADDGGWFVDAVLAREVTLDADLLDLEALTLTAEIVRTATSGNRVEILTEGVLGQVKFYSGQSAETNPANVVALDPGVGPPELTLGSGTTTTEPAQATIGMGSGATSPASTISLSAGKVYVGNHTGSDVHLGGTAWSNATATVHGSLFVLNAPTTGGAANVNIGPGGQIRESTSSLRYKQDIESVTIDPAAVLAMVAKTWRDKNAVAADPDTTERHVGFIAEDLDELGLTEFVVYEDGKPNAIQYDRLSVALLAVVKDQETRLARIEAALGL